MKSCKTCKFFNVPPDSIGRVRVRADCVYECIATVALPVWPDSITTHYDFRWPPRRSYMAGDDGTYCPMWEAKSKDKLKKENP